MSHQSKSFSFLFSYSWMPLSKPLEDMPARLAKTKKCNACKRCGRPDAFFFLHIFYLIDVNGGEASLR